MDNLAMSIRTESDLNYGEAHGKKQIRLRNGRFIKRSIANNLFREANC